MGFTREQLQEHRGGTLPDLLPAELKLLFVGINPGLLSAATGAHFARRGNRFYPALYRAGITDTLIDAAEGYREQDRAQLLERGIGITNISPLATARADELSEEQLLAGVARLHDLVQRRRPKVVAVLGVTAYRTAFRDKRAAIGWQESPWPGVELFVAPNPSGLNAHAQIADHAQIYSEIAACAGLESSQGGHHERAIRGHRHRHGEESAG